MNINMPPAPKGKRDSRTFASTVKKKCLKKGGYNKIAPKGEQNSRANGSKM